MAAAALARRAPPCMTATLILCNEDQRPWGCSRPGSRLFIASASRADYFIMFIFLGALRAGFTGPARLWAAIATSSRARVGGAPHRAHIDVALCRVKGARREGLGPRR